MSEYVNMGTDPKLFEKFDNAPVDGSTFFFVLALESGLDPFGGFGRVADDDLAGGEGVERFERNLVVFLVVGTPVENPLAGF